MDWKRLGKAALKGSATMVIVSVVLTGLSVAIFGVILGLCVLLDLSVGWTMAVGVLLVLLGCFIRSEYEDIGRS